MTTLLAAMLADSPTALWTLGDTSGTTAVDQMGNYNGTYQGGYTLGQSSLATFDSTNSTKFNGLSGTYVSTNSHIIDGFNACTFECFVKLTDSVHPYGLISSNNNDNKGATLFCLADSNIFRFAVGVSTSTGINDMSITINTGVVYHVVGVYDGSKVYCYVNGVKGSGTTLTGAIGAATINMGLACFRNNSDWLPAYLQYCAIYNQALSSTQISYHYAVSRQRDITQSSVVLYTPARTILQSSVTQSTATRNISQSVVVQVLNQSRSITESGVVQSANLVRSITESGVVQITNLVRSITESNVVQATWARIIAESAVSIVPNQTRTVFESAVITVKVPQSGPVIIDGPGAEVTIANGNTWWPLGDSHTRLPMQLLSDAGTPLDLTGATVTIKLRLNEPSSMYVASTGMAFILNASQGSVAWKFSTQDVATPGRFKMLVSVVYSSDTWNTYEQDFVVAGLAP